MDRIVTVTREDIEEATQKSSSHCAIATAIRHELSNAKYIAVDIQTIRFSIDNKRYIYLTPRKAQTAILQFDAGIKPAQFRLTLKNPQIVVRERKQAKEFIKNSRTKYGHVPKIKGGKTPPTASMRREFGIRAFDREAVTAR